MVTDLLDDDGLLDLRPRRSGARTNPDLEAWAKQHAAPAAPPTAPTEEGACHVCQRPARRRCGACGRPACTADLWVMFGLCAACAKAERVLKADRGAPSGNWLEEP